MINFELSYIGYTHLNLWAKCFHSGEIKLNTDLGLLVGIDQTRKLDTPLMIGVDVGSRPASATAARQVSDDVCEDEMNAYPLYHSLKRGPDVGEGSYEL